MRAISGLALVAAAVLAAGCATLSYDGMPAKGEPHAMAVERGGVDFVSIDGRPVTRPAFSHPKLRLTPGPHEILTRYNWEETDTDRVGDVDIDVTVHYWSRYAHAIAFDAREGNRYEIAAEAHLPSTDVSYSGVSHSDSTEKEGEVDIDIDHELTNPDDWRPFIARILPIKNYWKGRALPVAEIKTPVDGQKAAPAE